MPKKGSGNPQKRGDLMKKIARRDRLKIYGDLLSILYAENKEKIVLSAFKLRLKPLLIG